MSFTWVAGASILAVASFVFELTGVAAGMRLFDRIDQVRFRRLLFILLFILGLALCVHG